MASSKTSPARVQPPVPALPPAQQFRAAISSAQTNGADVSAMLLHLTLRDEAKLRRDRSVPLDDITFSDGEMRFLGVKVVIGETSALVVTPA